VFKGAIPKRAGDGHYRPLADGLMSVSSPQIHASTVSITAVAVKMDYFEKACLFQGHSDISLSEGLSRHQDGAGFRAVAITTSVRNYSLANVVLDADTLLLFQDGRMIRETAYFVPDPKRDDLTVDPATLIQLDAGEDVVIGYNNAHAGYQHWLTQCLPAIDWSLRRPRARGVRLLLPRLEPWQEDFIRILGHDTVARLTPQAGARYLLPHTEYSEFLNGSTSFGVCLSARDTARRVLEAVPSFPSMHTILYVPCVHFYYGSIDNEGDVVDFLQRHGVYIVDRRLTTADRINLFRHADVVMGPLGEGLTDIVFCKPGALLWEWMPDHHQNASFNRLAQAAEVDYWGDVFDSGANPENLKQWHVDLDVVSRRLATLSTRLTLPAPSLDANPAPANPKISQGLIVPSAANTPIDELMLAFESLGDNCEFGLVQRHGNAEPLGLLRFAGIFLPIEVRLEKLTAALERNFVGLGEDDTITVYLDGAPGRREFLVREPIYDLMYHTGVLEGEVALEEMRARELKRLRFLRGKLLEDLQSGDKIWVWKSAATSDAEQVQPLLKVLRSFGPNTLLWVVEGDAEHRPGMIERLNHDLIKGYIERFAPYDNAPDIRPASWFEVCQSVYNLHHIAQAKAEVEAEKALNVQPHRMPSAMDFLAMSHTCGLAIPKQDAVMTNKKPRSWLRRMFRFA
jgi:glycosyl transferase family 61